MQDDYEYRYHENLFRREVALMAGRLTYQQFLEITKGELELCKAQAQGQAQQAQQAMPPQHETPEN